MGWELGMGNFTKNFNGKFQGNFEGKFNWKFDGKFKRVTGICYIENTGWWTL